MSGRTYQTLMRYKGGLSAPPAMYTGIEYDYEVPDNTVVSSPGGVSGIQHHWTKGFYSNNSSTYDIFAGEGNRYPYGEFGNMYQVGQNAGTEMGMYPPGTDQMYTGNQSTAHNENFTAVSPTYGPGRGQPRGSLAGTTPVPGMEMIAAPDSGDVKSVEEVVNSDLTKLTHKIVFPNIWLVFAMFVCLYIALDFLVNAGESIIFTKFHGGKTPSWKWLVFYASIFIGIAVLLGFSVKDPFFALKKIEE